MRPNRQVGIHTETITLGALLKWAGVAATGAEAKAMIAAGRVLVNGAAEHRRGRRVMAGDVVAVQGGPMLTVVKADDDPASASVAQGLS